MSAEDLIVYTIIGLFATVPTFTGIYMLLGLDEKLPKLYKWLVKTIKNKTKKKTQVESDIEETIKDIKALEKQIEDVKTLNLLNQRKEALFMALERYKNED